jgi:hypothetical protein
VRSAVVTYIGVKGVGAAFNADTEAYRSITQDLNKRVAEGTLTVEQVKNLSPGSPMGTGTIVAIGAVVVGGLALYLHQKGKQGKHP